MSYYSIIEFKDYKPNKEYDLNTRKEHFEVYDWLETIKNNSPKE
jgi:hypothetical protein